MAPAVATELGLPEADCAATSTLINRYLEAEGEIAWHFDEVRAHGPAKVVASVSLGGPREFELKPRGAVGESSHLDMEPGSVLLMAGDVQVNACHPSCYAHCIVYVGTVPS